MRGSGTITQAIQTIAVWLSILLFAAWIAGQTIRDVTWLSGLLFYIPTPALFSWFSLLAIVLRRCRPGLGRFHIALALTTLLWVAIVENQWVPSGSSALRPATKRLVHWNVCRAVMGWPRQLSVILALKPDVIVLSEITDEVKATDFADFETLRIHGMLIATRGRMSTSGSLVAGGALDAYDVHCQLVDGPLNVIIADMTSNLNIGRDLYLRPLVQVIGERKPDFVVGDLNAPRRSLALCDLPPGYQHAYDAAGAGWSYTWPVPVPFLAIDQCICGPEIAPIRYQLESTTLSDHRIQILDFAFHNQTGLKD